MSVKIRPWKGQAGVWEIDVYLELPDGSTYRKRMKSPVPTKAGAERWAQEHAAHVLRTCNQPKPEPTKEVLTLEEFKEAYLDHARGRRQKPSTIDSKEAILNGRLLPALGSKRLDQICEADVAELMAGMASLSPKTVNNHLCVLNKLLKLAVKATKTSGLTKMPVEIELLPYESPQMDFYEHEVYEAVVAAAEQIDPRAVALVLLAGDAGLRAGELRALDRSDADHRRGVLHVQRAEWRGEITLPKGGKARTVPMTRRLSAALKAADHLRGPRVFYRDGAEPVVASEQTLRSWMGAVQKKARVRDDGEAGIHILRHTFCSHLAMKGASMMAIKELAGHVSLTTTQKYMHLAPSEKTRAIALLEQPWDLGARVEQPNPKAENISSRTS